MKKATVFLGLLSSILILSSCGKDDTPPVLKTYLKSYGYTTATSSANYNFIYDNQNRLQRVDYTDPSITQSYIVTAYGSNNNITEYVLRTVGTTNAFKYNANFDTQNRVISAERRDSISSNYVLAQTTTYTYAANKITRATTTISSGFVTTNEYTYNAAGNVTEYKFFNSTGTVNTNTTYTSYDNNKSPESLMPYFLTNGFSPANNAAASTFTATSGSTTNYTSALTYNSDGYPTQIVYTGGSTPVTYTYTYEKR